MTSRRWSVVPGWWLAILLSTTGCESQKTLFKATFEQDPVGGLPATNPPGSPSGDRLEITNAAGFEVVSTAGQRSLRARGSNVNADWAYCISDVNVGQFEDLRVTWTGLMNNGSDRVLVWIRAATTDQLAATLAIRDHAIWNESTTNAVVASLPTGRHTVNVILDPDTQRFRISVMPSGFVSAWVPWRAGVSSTEIRKGLQVDISNASTSTSRYYDFDGLWIFGDN